MNLKTLHQDFGTERQCLDFIFRTKYPDLVGKYHHISTRKAYVNSKGHQIYPLKGTIFQKTQTPLPLWFHALFLFAVSKNGISAAELSRQLGVTYKCAHRMGMQIRKAMKDEGLLFGTVEIDETYVGGVHKRKEGFRKKKAVMGLLEREGRLRLQVIAHRGTEVVIPQVTENVARGSAIMSDEFQPYKKLSRLGYNHQYTKHGKGHYVRGNVHSNGLEGAWGHLKPNLQSTYRSVKYLQVYLDEFAYRYNRRGLNPFYDLLVRAVSPS